MTNVTFNLSWPIDLSRYALSQDQAAQIKNAISEVFSAFARSEVDDVKFSKQKIEGQSVRHLVGLKMGQVVLQCPLPITLVLCRYPKGVRIILISKVILVSGSERKVRLAWNLSGYALIKKRLVTQGEVDFYSDLKPPFPEGMPLNWMIYQHGNKKISLLEKEAHGNLTGLIGQPLLNQPEIKHQIARSILSGVAHLHADIHRGNQRLAHNDLIPRNILFTLKEPASITTTLTDFSSAYQYDLILPASCLSPPEEILFHQKVVAPAIDPSGKIDFKGILPQVVAHRQQYLLTYDRWMVGYLLIQIADNHKISGLPFVLTTRDRVHALQNSNAPLLPITQEEVSSDLQRKREKLVDPVSIRLLDIAARLLRVNPDERITIEQALNHLPHLSL